MSRIPAKRRWNIINTWEVTGNIPLVAKQLGCNNKVAAWWIQRYLVTGEVKDLPRSGRTPILDEAAEDKTQRWMPGSATPSRSTENH